MLPNTLLAKLGYQTIVDRVPEAYRKAMFAKYLSAKYYYDNGADSNLYLFYEFMKNYN